MLPNPNDTQVQEKENDTAAPVVDAVIDEAAPLPTVPEAPGSFSS